MASLKRAFSHFDPLACLAVSVLSVQRLDRVVLDEVQPAANEAVADLELVVEELEWQLAVERLDPQRELGEFHGHRVAVDAVEAALDDVAREHRSQALVEAVVLRRQG